MHLLPCGVQAPPLLLPLHLLLLQLFPFPSFLLLVSSTLLGLQCLGKGQVRGGREHIGLPSVTGEEGQFHQVLLVVQARQVEKGLVRQQSTFKRGSTGTGPRTTQFRTVSHLGSLAVGKVPQNHPQTDEKPPHLLLEAEGEATAKWVFVYLNLVFAPPKLFCLSIHCYQHSKEGGMRARPPLTLGS